MTNQAMKTPADTLELAATLERNLMDKYGPMVANDALRVALGYPSMDAFRQALVRKTVPVPVFTLEKRRGKFALVKDVAQWLACQRNALPGEFGAVQVSPIGQADDPGISGQLSE